MGPTHEIKRTAIHFPPTEVIIPENSDLRYYENREIGYDYDSIKQFPRPGEKGMSRFIDLLPIDTLRVSLLGGEGDTPLSSLGQFGRETGLALFVKDESRNPTGVFKDRESAVAISHAVEHGAEKVYVISSGNAALSTAAYAQRAGIECTCYVPEKTSLGKQRLIQLYGAKLETIPGFYEEVYRTVIDTNPDGLNVTTGQNIIRTEGNKTIAYEIWEQMNEIPDTVVVPCGNGGCLAGIWKGFKELKKLGKINKLPQMVAVQIKDASPFSQALTDGSDIAILGTIEDSIAEGIVAQESYASPKAMRAIRESGGYVIEVTDKEIVEALVAIIKLESFIPEPTSASVFAAVSKLKNQQGDSVVLINTGLGAKLIEEVLELVHKSKSS